MDKFSFSLQHGAMLLQYSGISFISGAVNHGFFSGARSLWTAAVGMLLFVLGLWLEHWRSGPARQETSELVRALVWGSLLSIGLGFFTGGLQHFPDSPGRSAWVVPLGFVISVVALTLHDALRVTRTIMTYALVLGLLVTAGSWGAWQWLLHNPQQADAGHSHADQVHETPPPLAGAVLTRSIEVRMDDRMRFTPSSLDAVAGETVRLVVHNDGKADHELVLGTPEDIRAHADDMKKAGGEHADGHSHGAGVAIRVAPGQKGELVVTFARAGELQIACLLPGHFEAGMRGSVRVAPAANRTGGASVASAGLKPALENTARDHGNHKP